MAGAPNILLVDSDPDDVRMVREVVESAGLDLHVSADRGSALDAIHAIHPDLVLIQAQAREIEAEDVARELHHEAGSSTPPIVLIHDGAVPGWASADSGAAPRELLRPIGAPALLSLLAHYFPSAFLPPVAPSSAASRPAPTLIREFGVRKDAAAAPSDGLGADSFEEGPLGDLLDMVFPVEDSGDLAASLTQAQRTFAPPSGAGRPRLDDRARHLLDPPPFEPPATHRHPQESPSQAFAEAERTWPPVPAAPSSSPDPLGVRTWPPTQAAAPPSPDPLGARTWPPTATVSPDVTKTSTPGAHEARGDSRPMDRTWPPTPSSAAHTAPVAGKTDRPHPAKPIDRTWPPTPTASAPDRPRTAKAPERTRPSESIPLSEAPDPLAPPAPTAARPAGRAHADPIPSAAPSPGPRGGSAGPVTRGDFVPERAATPGESVPTLMVQPAADSVETFGESRSRRDHREAMSPARTRPVGRARRARSRRWLILALLGVAAAAATYALTRWISLPDTDLRPNVRHSRRGRTALTAPKDTLPPDAPAASEGSLLTPETPLIPESTGHAAGEAPQSASSSPAPSAASGAAPELTAAIGPHFGSRTHPPAAARPHPDRDAQAVDRRSSKTSPRSSVPERRAPADAAPGVPAASRPAPADSEDVRTRPPSSAPATSAEPQTDQHQRSSPPSQPEERGAASGENGSRPQVAPAPPSPPPPSPDAPAARDAGAQKAGTEQDESASSHPRETPPASAKGPEHEDSAREPARPAPSPPAPAAGERNDPSSPPANEMPLVAPVPISRPQPRYPASARGSKIAGSVRLLVRVSENGSVTVARVVGPLSPALDDAAVRAVLEWKYRPAQLGDRTVSAWVEESIAFKP